MGHRKEVQVLTAAVTFAAITVIFSQLFYEGYYRGRSWPILAFYGLAITLSLIASILCLDIWCLKPADSHTLKTLLSQYKELLLRRLKAPYIRSWIKRKTRNIKKVNEETLMRILKQNQHSQYGREYKFSQIYSQEQFVLRHPVKTSEDYQPYVNRIMQGEEDVLYCGETYFLAKTSGTTGKQKLLPMRRKCAETGHWLIHQASFVKLLPIINLQRYAQFHIYSPQEKISDGKVAGALSRLLSHFPYHNLIPAGFSKLYDAEQSYYAQAIFSLAEPELQYIHFFSADLAYSYFKYMTNVWQNLCDDIEQGSIGKHSNMPEKVRLELSNHLLPNPVRANQLRKAMEMGTTGLAKQVWPNMKFVVMGKSGAFGFGSKLLADNHLSGIDIVAHAHGATEGFTGIVLDEDSNIGVHTLIPYPSFVEFIPLEEIDKENPRTIFPEEAVEGSFYEVVHTNENGLYRCRYGDVIKVVGFKHKALRYQFMYRVGQRLNIAYERTPAIFLLEAMKSCESNIPPGIKLVNYTTTESTVVEVFTGKQSKGHYIYFMEFDTNTWFDMSVMADQIENSLIKMSESYQRYKNAGNIGDLEIIQVETGTFEELKSYIWNHTPHGQFKMPRVLRKDSAIKYLLSRIIQK